MFFLSALMVYSSVNNLSVLSGRFINFWVKPVLSSIKCLPKGHNTLALLSLEQVAIQILLMIILGSAVAQW